MRVRWVNAALLEAYANWPELLPFMAPEMEDTLIILELYPGVLLPPFASRGKNAIDMYYPPVTLVLNVSAQLSGSDFQKWSAMARGSVMSGSPLDKNFIPSSRAIPALLTRS